MILDEKVKLRWSYSWDVEVINQYKSLGYKFKGWNTEFTVKINELHINSSVKVNVKCDKCEMTRMITYGSMPKTKAYKELGCGSYLCKDCVFKVFPLDVRKPVDEKKRITYEVWHNDTELFVPKEHLKIDLSVDNNYTIIPEISGIYKFYNENDELLYLGKAKNLRTRVSTHIKNKSNTKQYSHLFKSVSCSYVDYQKVDELEIYMINQLKPKYNVKDVYTYTSSTI